MSAASAGSSRQARGFSPPCWFLLSLLALICRACLVSIDLCVSGLWRREMWCLIRRFFRQASPLLSLLPSRAAATNLLHPISQTPPFASADAAVFSPCQASTAPSSRAGRHANEQKCTHAPKYHIALIVNPQEDVPFHSSKESSTTFANRYARCAWSW